MKPRILLSSGALSLVADAGQANGIETLSFRALGYRQTMLSAAKGGKCLNSHAWRFRNGGMRALARSFKGQAFIGGHDWGDPRLRGGDIANAYAEEIEHDTEFAIFYEIIAKAPWAIEGLKNGTIDRFSLGVMPRGEITCTIHDVPVWSTDDCWCWPGREVDGVLAEWEFEDADGLELSAVNVPAVEGTGIVPTATADRQALTYADLAALCGRPNPRLMKQFERVSVGGVPTGGFTPAPAARTIAESNEPPRGDQMDRALVCKNLGLPVTATDEEIAAKFAELNGAAAQMPVLRTHNEQLASENQAHEVARLTAHVDSEISRLKSTKQVAEKVIATLRAAADTAKGGSRAAFDQSLALVEASAADLAPIAGAARGELQSDKAPTSTPGSAELAADGPDSYELNKANPHLASMMRTAKVTIDNVRAHGSRTFNVLPNLRELADATEARERK